MTLQGDRLPFNPSVLSWARKRRAMSVSEAAETAGVSEDRIIQWEAGDRAPTVTQGRRLAEVYDRPFLEFFATSVPDLPAVQLVTDYRFHRKQPSEKEIVRLEEVQRWAESQRLNAISLTREIGEDLRLLPRDLAFTTVSNVETAAAKARAAMSFDIGDQMALKAAQFGDVPAMLRSRLESLGVLVLKQSDLGRIGARGICLYANPMPVIVFGNEAPGAQAFTLMHEFGHVLLGASGISGPLRFGKNVKSGPKLIESWCNQFAAAFLIPSDSLAKIVPRPNKPAATFDLVQLKTLAQRFAVSRHAMLVRLVNLGYVEAAYYWRRMRNVFLREEHEHTSFGRAQYYGTRYINSRGRLYTSLVLEAWNSGRISSHNAAEYMGIKNLSHLMDIRDRFAS